MVNHHVVAPLAQSAQLPKAPNYHEGCGRTKVGEVESVEHHYDRILAMTSAEAFELCLSLHSGLPMEVVVRTTPVQMLTL